MAHVATMTVALHCTVCPLVAHNSSTPMSESDSITEPLQDQHFYSKQAMVVQKPIANGQ